MLLAKTVNEIKSVLTIIFNKSIQEGTLPDPWKKANVCPIFKKGSRKDPSNYRPISLTSVPSKILQRIVRDEIVKHMDTNNLFTKEQHGFRQGRSCTTQLLECLEDWTISMDEGHNTDVIYLDFSKAFDKKLCHASLKCLLTTPNFTNKYLLRVAEQELQNSIDKMVKWAENWLMTLNLTKCKHMEIGNNEKTSQYNIRNESSNITIQKVSTEKDLGVIIDEKLNFSEQAKHSSTKRKSYHGSNF
ncbi:uncharacterized protein [Argopecten irradians]|uniref:uncharacterized protein n=1 Tax=Argopecten irradians TaxID=31199 RepID=UPI003722B5CC